MQAMTEDDMGATAMSADRELQLLLVELMDRKFALLLRGRAAVLLASLKPGAATHNFTQVAAVADLSHASADGLWKGLQMPRSRGTCTDDCVLLP